MSENTDNMESHKIKELEQEKIILKEINEFLEKKELENNKILDSMSHEFRTPLVIIKSYVDMILQEEFGKINSLQHERLEHVQNNINLLTMAIFKTLEQLNNAKQ
ncbi:MAG: histidine kinase dimerization/phospho-acceptor domain-containing protein [Nitrosarchaeum sp.]